MNPGNEPTIETVTALAVERKLTIVDHGNGHYTIKGGEFMVQFYPETTRGARVFVNGTSGARTVQTARQVIESCFVPKGGRVGGRRHQDPKYYRRVRRKLLAIRPRCYYCDCPLTWEASTIDHRIPLDKGGSNGQDNLVLACESCNRMKANKLVRRHQVAKGSGCGG